MGLVIAGQLGWNWFKGYEVRSRSKSAEQRRANAAAREALSKPMPHLARRNALLAEKRRQEEEMRRQNRARAIELAITPFAVTYHLLRTITGAEKRETERLMYQQAQRDEEESQTRASYWDE